MFEFPAHRIALAWRSLNRKYKKDRVFVIAVQVSIAFFLLPVFLAAWVLVVIWNIMHTFLSSFLTLPRAKWKDFQAQIDRQVEEKERKKFQAEEMQEAQEEARRDTQKEADRTLNEEHKEDKKKQLKQKSSNERFEEKRRRDRKKEEHQLNEQVALLVNPKKLYKSKIKGAISRRKQEVEPAITSERNDGTSLRKSHDDHASVDPMTPPQEQRSMISTIMSVFQHQSDKATANKEAV